MFNRIAPVLLVFSLVAAGCSSSQDGTDQFVELGWGHSYDAVPTTAAAVFGFDANAEHAGMLAGEGPGDNATLSSMIMSKMIEEVLSELNIASIADLGVDPEGDMTMFVWRDSAHVVIRAHNPDLVIDRFAGEAPSSVEQTEIELAGHRFISFDESNAEILAGALDGFAVISFVPDENTAPRALVTELIAGVPDEGRFVDGTTGEKVLRVEGASGMPVAFLYGNLGELNNIIGSIGEFNEGELLEEIDRDLMGVDENADLMDELADDSAGARCAAAAEDIASRYRWIGSSVYETDSGYVSTTRLAMSAGQADNTRDVLVGAPMLDGPVNAASLYSVALGLDLRMLLERLPGDDATDLTDCRNIAFMKGALAEMASEIPREVRRELALVTGSMSLAIINVDLQGMVPLVDGALTVYTGQPERLAAQLQSEIEGAPDVRIEAVSDARYPTTEISSPAAPLTLRIVQGEDRVVFTLGTIAPNVLTQLVEGETGSDVAAVHINGDRLAALLQQAAQYAEDMGGPYGGTDPALDMLMRMMGGDGSIPSADSSISFQGNDLVIHSVQTR